MAELNNIIIVDDFLEDPEELIRYAETAKFVLSEAYPGVQAMAPRYYIEAVYNLANKVMNKTIGGIRSKLSITTVERDNSPHVDSHIDGEYAGVHYLFKGSHGGTIVGETKIEPVFNRIVFYKANTPHKPDLNEGSYVNDVRTGRFTVVSMFGVSK